MDNFITGLFDQINQFFSFYFFFGILVLMEIWKSILKYDEKTQRYHIGKCKKGIKVRTMTVLTGLLLTVPVYYTEIYNINIREDFLYGIQPEIVFKLIITFCITITLYEFIFKVIISQLKSWIERIFVDGNKQNDTILKQLETIQKEIEDIHLKDKQMNPEKDLKNEDIKMDDFDQQDI